MEALSLFHQTGGMEGFFKVILCSKPDPDFLSLAKKLNCRLRFPVKILIIFGEMHTFTHQMLEKKLLFFQLKVVIVTL